MQVKIRYHDILYETEKATLFLISEREQWLPKIAFRLRGNFIICSLSLAQKLSLRYIAYIHVPEYIAPKHNQEPIDELLYNSK